MKPTPKAPAIEAILEKMAQTLFSSSRKDSIRSNVCVKCSGEAKTFTNQISLKEYGISGLCQTCQDSIFPN